jgi:hypothetical protein
VSLTAIGFMTIDHVVFLRAHRPKEHVPSVEYLNTSASFRFWNGVVKNENASRFS